ncbi:MAG TPA: hypothetical protein PLV32_01930, partial [Chitinophagaceae bacterium]|nr:hypothetical protein [Chitinophagaceae bacterium]
MRKSYLFALNRKKTFCLAGILALCSVLSLNAQDDTEKGLPFITNYSAKTYKAPPQTFSIIEDNRGFLYFGIQNGILEYDGVKWRKVIFKEVPAIVRAMARGEDGTIY